MLNLFKVPFVIIILFYLNAKAQNFTSEILSEKIINGPEGISCISTYDCSEIYVSSYRDGNIYQIDLKNKKTHLKINMNKSLHNLGWITGYSILGITTDIDGNIFITAPNFKGGSVCFYHKNKNLISCPINNLGLINGLFYDHDKSELYLTDQKDGRILKILNKEIKKWQSGSFETNNESKFQVIAQDLDLPNGITKVKDSLYFLEGSILASSEKYLSQFNLLNNQLTKLSTIDTQPDGIIYDEKRNSLIITEHEMGLIQEWKLNDKFPLLRTLANLNFGRNYKIAPANIIKIKDNTYAFTDLWDYDFYDVAKAAYQNLENDHTEKHKMVTYHTKVYQIVIEE